MMIDVKVTRVIDGDTFEGLYTRTVYDEALNIDITITNRKPIKFRMFGIDAPEVRGDHRNDGLTSKAWLQLRIEGKTVQVEEHGLEKYGRTLATIWMDVELTPNAWQRTNLNQYMVAMRMAETYGTKPSAGPVL